VTLRAVIGTTVVLTGLAVGPGLAGGLVDYRVEDGAIPHSLTDQLGVPERGRAVVLDPARGNCVICHPMPVPEVEFPGDVGPDLAGVGSRYDAGQLRLRVVDPKRLNPDTVMPAYYRVEGLYRVLNPYRGEPILTAQEVEDVVAYLLTLKEGR
jgi:L-cysteine S-thiosulfotransferase